MTQQRRRTSRHRLNKKTGTLTLATALGVTAAAILLPHANAATNAPDPLKLSLTKATSLGQTLSADLGGSAAGWYYEDGSDRLVMNVLNEDDAKTARAKGASARVVQHITTELTSAGEELGKSPVAGTAWSVDPRTNKLSVLVDGTVKGTDWAKLSQQTKALGDRVSVKRVGGHFKMFTEGGDAIWAGRGRCSLGFNVVKDGKPGFLTAGHCTMAGDNWAVEQGGEPVAKIVAKKWPGNDYSLAMYTDPKTDAPSAVDQGDAGMQKITGAAEAAVGMAVKRMGSTTGLHDGKVTGLDATVNYRGGYTVHGLIQTDVCAEPGDSGGSMFSGDKAVGLTSGGGGNCSSGGETFFQPVTKALAAVGAQIGQAGSSSPAAPGDDCGGKPSEPGEPTEPGEPSEPGQPGEPAQPGLPGDPGEGGDQPGAPAE